MNRNYATFVAMFVVSLFTIAGEPATLRELYRGDLIIKASSEWTASECDKLRAILKQSYPLLEQYYGKPSRKGVVTLKKVHGGTSQQSQRFEVTKDRIVVSGSNEIELSNEVIEFPVLIVHELAHRFHDRFMIFLAKPPKRQPDGSVRFAIHDPIEEGMAHAVSELVRKKLNYGHPRTHEFELSSGFNKPQITYAGNIEVSDTTYPIRIELAGWTINQWQAKHPGFMNQCNQGLYRLGNVPVTTGQFVAIAEKVTPGFKKWFVKQHIFQRTTQPGYYLYVVGDSRRGGIVLYARMPNGSEKPMAGEPIKITFEFEGFTQRREARTNERGLVPIELDKVIKRYRLTASWKDLTDTFELKP